jgi:hypothetical protein
MELNSKVPYAAMVAKKAFVITPLLLSTPIFQYGCQLSRVELNVFVN